MLRKIFLCTVLCLFLSQLCLAESAKEESSLAQTRAYGPVGLVADRCFTKIAALPDTIINRIQVRFANVFDLVKTAFVFLVNSITDPIKFDAVELIRNALDAVFTCVGLVTPYTSATLGALCSERLYFTLDAAERFIVNRIGTIEGIGQLALLIINLGGRQVVLGLIQDVIIIITTAFDAIGSCIFFQ